ncbi:hypothetical protein Htur_5050 (plasmid) [Haloterrigena turkmenica DSM 5511]|uniref:Uncharacterized protein n=1 Tax=Haloterrigena turkmenica (strain ATCC 51198 / DSM 5511 / JCM 9101 / NCIMB 13204 / VKM B-1734 / 4k) TaxID=543526 RepID=D2S3J0_HALTV|nr:hypothetical protein [Haloterrigena turkmenica]ADB63937.1 hypothetical protein Htur_5050 [Haloterrigena turkmenica DSM 5511]
MSQSRTQRVRGRSPPDREDGWQVTTVPRRTTNDSGAAVCAVTGATVPLEETHYFVTLRKPTPGRHQPPEFDHLVVAEGALGELDEWLEDD